MIKRLTPILLLVLAFRFTFESTLVDGDSMSPTLENGELHWTVRSGAMVQNLQRGQIVVVEDRLSGERLVKRVIGLPGEKVQMIWGRILINGNQLNEPYLVNNQGWCMLPIQLDKQEYWVIGDNRLNSTHHLVETGDIKGKLLLPSDIMPLNSLDKPGLSLSLISFFSD